MIYFSNNIKCLRKLQNLSQEELSNKIGILRTTISNYEKNVSTPDYETLIKFANFFDISVDDLLRKKISDINDKNAHLNAHLYAHPSEKISIVSDSVAEYSSSKKTIIPFYGIEASAGPQFFFNNLPEVPEFISVPFNVPGCIAIPIYGSSMEPEYKSGDIVIIREIKDLSVLNYGFPYIVITEELRLFKILRKGTGSGQVLLHSLNQQYEPIALELSKIRKLFIVEALISKKST